MKEQSHTKQEGLSSYTPTHTLDVPKPTSLDSPLQEESEQEPIQSYIPSSSNIPRQEQTKNKKESNLSLFLFVNYLFSPFTVATKNKVILEPSQKYLYSFIQTNILHYLSLFQPLVTSKKVKVLHLFSLGAFLFGPAWFAYRRMYKLAILALALDFSLHYSLHFLYTHFFEPIRPNWISYILHYPVDLFNKELYTLIIILIPMLFFGFIGKILYYNHIKVIYNQFASSDSPDSSYGLSLSLGGTSLSGAIFFLIINYILTSHMLTFMFSPFLHIYHY